MKILYLSFWDLSLTNFPNGQFRKREISGSEAKELIDSNIQSGTLDCVSADDLNAPYKTQEKKKHGELRSVLLNTHGIDLQFKQFNTEDDDDDEPCYYITPLELVSIDKDSSLLVITCSYTMDINNKDDSGFPNFPVVPDSIEFHLFESI